MGHDAPNMMKVRPVGMSCSLPKAPDSNDSVQRTDTALPWFALFCQKVPDDLFHGIWIVSSAKLCISLQQNLLFMAL